MKEITTVRKTYELSIGDEKYHFRLSFMAWLKLEQAYGTNAVYIMENFSLGIDRITNMMRILSCACVEEISFEELVTNIELTPQNLEVLSEMTLVINGMQVRDGEEQEDVKKKYDRPSKDDHIVDYEFYYTVARSYLGYSYNEFWYEANPYEVMEAWAKYCTLNGWDKKEDEEEADSSEKDYYTIDDL